MKYIICAVPFACYNFDTSQKNGIIIVNIQYNIQYNVLTPLHHNILLTNDNIHDIIVNHSKLNNNLL